MEIINKEINPLEKKAKVSILVSKWKENKKKAELESKLFVQSAEFQKLKEELRRKNAKKGIIIPRI